ncbi:MAG: hypothetical protein K1X53_07230 [Candidatus Sumerlaeaceae bacterium]|nr:hypothetical protein [Candidatus Sumerlaeaceae bacterium]
MTADELIAEIEEHFADVTRGEGMTLAQGAVVADYGAQADWDLASQVPCDARWQDIPDSVLDVHAHTLNFLDQKGFRFYLPAFMRRSLRLLGEIVNEPWANTVGNLTFWPQDSEEPNNPSVDWMRECWDGFTPEQGRVILSFLDFTVASPLDSADQEMAAKAIEDYWKKFRK